MGMSTRPVARSDLPIFTPNNEHEQESMRVTIDGIGGFCHIIRIVGMEDQLSFYLDSEHPDLGLGTITSDFTFPEAGVIQFSLRGPRVSIRSS